MSSSGIAVVTAEEWNRSVESGQPVTATALIASGELAQAGCPLAVGLVLPGYQAIGGAQWAPRWPSSLGFDAHSPWPVETGDGMPGGFVQGPQAAMSMRIEMRIGSVQTWWWSDVVRGVYWIPPCDEIRVAYWLSPVVPVAPGGAPLTFFASLAPSPISGMRYGPGTTTPLNIRPWEATIWSVLEVLSGDTDQSWTGECWPEPSTRTWAPQFTFTPDGSGSLPETIGARQVNTWGPWDTGWTWDGRPIISSWSLGAHTAPLSLAFRVICRTGP